MVLHFAFQIYHPGLQNVALIWIHISKWCTYFILHFQMLAPTCSFWSHEILSGYKKYVTGRLSGLKKYITDRLPGFKKYITQILSGCKKYVTVIMRCSDRDILADDRDICPCRQISNVPIGTICVKNEMEIS